MLGGEPLPPQRVEVAPGEDRERARSSAVRTPRSAQLASSIGTRRYGISRSPTVTVASRSHTSWRSSSGATARPVRTPISHSSSGAECAARATSSASSVVSSG